MRVSFLIIFFLAVFSSIDSRAELKLTDKMSGQYVGKHIEVLEDEDSKLSITDVITMGFESSEEDILNLGVSNSTFWLKLNLKNMTSYKDWLIALECPILDEVDFYELRNGEIINSSFDGVNYNFFSRKYDYPFFIYDLNLKNGEDKVYYFRIKSGEQIFAPIKISKKQEIFDEVNKRDILFSIYIGILGVMFLYNLFLFTQVKDKSYLYYCFYLISVLLVQSSLLGYNHKILWSNSSWLASEELYLLSCLVGISANLFMMNFLKTSTHVPFLHKFLKAFNYIYFLYLGIALIGFGQSTYELIQLTATVISLFMLYVAIVIAKQGFRPARFFLIAWCIFLFGVFVYAMKDFGLIPFNGFSNYTMPIGSAFEVVLLSFALANKINILREEKEASQAAALTALEEKQELQREQNRLLEAKVQERTAELEQANEELNVTLENLKSTQTQLVDAEKMASLGQLTAGIAHEINNPINFVAGNITPLKKDIDDLVAVLNKYGELPSEGASPEQLKEIEELKEDLDVDFLIEEMEMLINGIDDGANRTAEIIKGLKNFSRLDESELKKANLIEGIESTLVLLNSTIGNENVIVEKEFEEIPFVECYPGKINQLFMNILNNAIHATETNVNSGKDRVIKIGSRVNDGFIEISIGDNGIGMDEQTKAKVFEPFFTTKEVGQGTGLGLSIVYKIIKSHNGQIKIQSVVGEGTTFLIYIPVDRGI